MMFYWLSSRFLKIFFSIFYRYKVYGTQHPYPGGAMIAANHASFFDPPLIGASWPEEIHYLARASLFNVFLFKLLLSNLNAHPIHGTAQDLSSFKLICHLLNENKKVVIFPEGSRTEDGNLQPIKTGAAMLALRTKRPIIPTYIHGTYNVWPRSKKWPKLSGELGCVFGSPIQVEPYLDMDKKKAQELLTQKIQHSIESLRNWYLDGAKGSVPTS